MAGFFSPGTLEQVRAASDIVDIIGACLPLKRAGANFVALCPFHKEKTPSFHVHPARQIFHCFGCHKGGDVFTFLKEYESIDFPEAVRRLAERANIPLEQEQSGPETQARQIKDLLLKIHEQITERWHNALKNEASGQVARDYLERRKVSAEAVSAFRLGFAPEAWDDTVNWAKAKGHPTDLMEKAGLIIRKEDSDRYYDRFRGRLMFPICDEQGRVVGFSARILSGDEKTAKYVNSPETPIFIKSRIFYGLDKSKRALLETGHAVICEGQLDLIACHMAGIQNVVAPQGTAFTADHARILKRYVSEVVLCFDSDEAGQKAMVRALDPLLGAGLAIRVAVVPSPHDPDSLIKERGAEAFQKVLTDAQGFFEHYLQRLCSKNDTSGDKGRLTVLRSMAEAVLKTGNQVLIDKYAQKTALRLGVSPDSVRAEFRKAQRASPGGPTREEISAQEPERSEPLSPAEHWLVRLMFVHEDLVPWVCQNLDVEWLHHPQAKRIIGARINAHIQQSWTSLPAFLEGFSTEDQALITEVTTSDKPLPTPSRTVADIVTRLRNDALDLRIVAITRKLGQPAISQEEIAECINQQNSLRAAKNRTLVPPE